MDEHIRHFAEFLCILESAPTSLKTSKCNFFRTTVTYLKWIARPRKLDNEDCASWSLKEAFSLCIKRNLCSYLGSRNGFCRFVQIFAHIAIPLNDMLRKDSLKTFDKLFAEQTDSFKKLIKVLASDPLLHLSQPRQLYSVDTDASGHQKDCVLF